MQRRRVAAVRTIALAAAAVVSGAALPTLAQPISATWIGGFSNWERADDWTTNPFYPTNNSPAGASYDVVIAGTNDNCLLTTDVTVNRVDVSGSARLTLQRNIPTMPTSFAGLHTNAGLVLRDTASLRMTGGTLYGTITNLGTGTVELDGVDGKTLDGVALDSDMIIRAGQDLIPIRHGITLFPNRTITLTEPGNGGGLRTLDDATFAHARLVFGSNGPDGTKPKLLAENSQLTIASDMTIATDGGGGQISTSGANGRVTNFGTLASVVQGQTLQMNGGSWTNNGTFVVGNGGTITVGSATLRTSALGTVLNTGNGTFAIGDLDNTNDILKITQASGSFLHDQGTIRGGRIETAPGTSLVIHNWNQTFIQDVTLAGDLRVAPGTGTTALFLKGQLNLDGGQITMQAVSQARGAVININALPFTFAGNGTISMEGARFQSISSAASVTIASAVTLQTRNGGGGGLTSGTEIINHGTIDIAAAGAGLAINVPSFTNNGRVACTNSSTMSVTGNIANNGTIAIDNASAVLQGFLDGAGTASVSSGTLSALRVRLDHVSVGDSGYLKIPTNGAESRCSRVSDLSLAPAATIDLADNDLVVQDDEWRADDIALVIANARAGGAWTGFGITSSAAKSHQPANTTLGVLTGSEWLAVTGTNLFDGIAVDITAALVRYTYYGDTDLNGVVNFDDYSRIDGGFNNGHTGWLNGDFDYNGVVNFDDYALIDLAFNTQGATLIRDGSIHAVPEPASLLPVLAGMGLNARRIRRRFRLGQRDRSVPRTVV